MDKIQELEQRISVLEQAMIRMQQVANKSVQFGTTPAPLFPQYTPPPTQFIPAFNKGCPKCGIGAGGALMSYSCSDPKCPTMSQISC